MTLCHGETACPAMTQAMQQTETMQTTGHKVGTVDKDAVAFTMTAVITGKCPSCKRKVRE